MSGSIGLIGCLFLSLSMAAQTPAEKVVQRDLEKTASMTAEESFSYARRTYTMNSMEVLAKMLEAWRLARGRYPDARSIDALRDALTGMFDATRIPTKDKWGSEFRYTITADGKQYRIVSAGGDRMFDEASWTKRGELTMDDEDAVLAGGAFVRRWTDATKPGLGDRARLSAAARALLAKADSQLAADDRAGALASYIDAVKADRRAADLETLRRYVPRAAARPETALHIAALRQYLDLYPDDPAATRDLLGVLPSTEALTVADRFVAKRSGDPEAYEMRSGARMKAGRPLEALADFEKAASLDASNAERQYRLGVATYEVATKTPSLDPARARELLRQSLAALEHAELLRPKYLQSLLYRSIVLRKLSELETDAAARQKLSAEADAVRTRAMEMAKGSGQKDR